MSKWVFGLILIAAFVGLAVLVQKGIIHWQPLTMLFAAIAAPFKFVMGLFGSEQKIREKFAAEREQEHAFQADLENRIKQREERVTQLHKEIESLDANLRTLKSEREQIESNIGKMTVEQKRELARKLLEEDE